jgi:SAM-dependent methyltransferase
VEPLATGGSAPQAADVSTHLADHDAERADFQRVLDAVAEIQRAPLDDLRSVDWLAALIRGVGLVPIPEAAITYEGEEDYLNASQQGLIQLPREFARYLRLLAEHRPASYLEIGCFNGATASLATAYLQRFNPAVQATTIDLWPAFLFYHEVRELIPLRYVVGKTSYDLAGEKFDAVFIDGDHSFDWAWADYQNVGRTAKVCALHDVNNAPYRELPLGGVCGVWDLLRRDEAGPGVEFIEIFEHPSREIMGLGVRLAR